ncbi:hypothetical protein [Sporomusa silvacetica]|uniref:hypothetical protein n=1 Tax=Sporomusa silvacetica TaxID=55504 RepID=UPI001181BFC5|nr:hypothetical protein [Sporomusa silvacetica]
MTEGITKSTHIHHFATIAKLDSSSNITNWADDFCMVSLVIQRELASLKTKAGGDGRQHPRQLGDKYHRQILDSMRQQQHSIKSYM